MEKTKEHNIFKNNDMMYHISTFLPYKDKNMFMLSKKNIYTLKSILFRNDNKKAIIITSFFKKCKYIFKRIEFIHEIEKTMRFHDMHPITTSKTMALYYFKYYESKYTHSWYNGVYSTKRNLVQDFIDTSIENPSKYDLYRLQKKMPLENILTVGW